MVPTGFEHKSDMHSTLGNMHMHVYNIYVYVLYAQLNKYYYYTAVCTTRAS